MVGFFDLHTWKIQGLTFFWEECECEVIFRRNVKHTGYRTRKASGGFNPFETYESKVKTDHFPKGSKSLGNHYLDYYALGFVRKIVRSLIKQDIYRNHFCVNIVGRRWMSKKCRTPSIQRRQTPCEAFCDIIISDPSSFWSSMTSSARVEINKNKSKHPQMLHGTGIFTYIWYIYH